ncbi:hypothetical protein shim_35670 [Shimia sp. SK013]|uniref:hypothetical protein n=1 Tax=Shimia sp. SK013 TaxID=1389006 RepID=UPI0006CD5392|nr:hypothetical protein [Shimia sp. SK013]KPA20239.1 hypothetical protein shim_35670 [Shimia sp. SK013]
MSDENNSSTPAGSATPTYAEAVQIAKECLLRGRVSECDEISRQALILSWASSAEALSLSDGWIGKRGFVAVKASKDSMNIPELVEAASWNPLAFQAAGLLSARLLERGDQLPSELVSLAIEILNGKQPPPTPRNERKGNHAQTWWRKYYVWKAVAELVDLGFKSTRNVASEHVSACDAVAEAMSKLNVRPSSYGRVYDFWKECDSLKSGSQN